MELGEARPGLQRTVLLTMMMLKWGILCAAPSSKCLSFPCQNGATCTDTADDYTCSCPREPVLYAGKHCETLYDACAVAACANCTSQLGTEEYACVCPPGVTGADCSLDVDECAGTPCAPPRSRCMDRPGGYTCHCPRGRGGDDCVALTEECADRPCLHGGTCLELPDGFKCACRPGFRGDRCEEDVDECQLRPCQNGAICLDGVNAYRCFCVPGFQGYNCEIDINECASRPCRNNATCVNGKDRYLCQCLLGYTGVNCEMEINECESRPCQNGATCQDQLGVYTCDCLPGYAGQDCEVDINECESEPCRHQGTCIDHIDSYECDCSNTGFTGPRCEQDIPECASNPCQHNSTCVEEVNRFTCECWPGYEGDRCEVDVDECAARPCQNGGRCFQRSDRANYGRWRLMDWEFHYSDAAGYLCRCLPGFTGDNCSVNIDECQSQPCYNQGTCQDLINSYNCMCPPGYTGRRCQVDMDECESQPCQNGASCQDAVANYLCLCPEPEPGDAPWGGRHCDVRLVGCVEHQCENGATCEPWLGPHGEQRHTCHCSPGFHDDRCATPTTFSFSTPGFVLVYVPPANTTQPEPEPHSCAVVLRFRTTLPNAVLFHQRGMRDYLSLEIVGGALLAWAAAVSGERLEARLPGPVNEGKWHEVNVSLGPVLSLLLRGPGCGQDGCVTETQNPLWPPLRALVTSARVYVGGVPPELLTDTDSGTGFVGCMEDVLVNSRLILPQDIPLEQAYHMELGCRKTEWCHPDPCSGHGNCVDLWTSFFCTCHSPFHGDSCSQEYTAWTFSHEDTLSYASYTIGASHSANFTFSLLLRSLKQQGLVFQLKRDSKAYLSIYLKAGRIQVNVPPAPPAATPVFVTNGDMQLLMVEVRHGLVTFGHRGQLYQLGSVPAVRLKGGDTAYVGGLPRGTSAEAWGGHFKGCLQDVRLGGIRLDMSTWSGLVKPSADEAYFPYEVDNVEPGCVSDDSCKVDSCHNGGWCMVTWNDFVCVCNINFTGKACETRVWCPSEPCTAGGRCVDLTDGYECLTEVTLENNALRYSAKDSLTSPVTNVSMELRTRAQSGVLLKASEGVELFRVDLRNGSVAVEIRSGNSMELLSFTSKMAIADGAWHHMQVSMAEPHHRASPWMITVDGRSYTSSMGAASTLDFLSRASILLAEDFSGCLGEVRVAGVYFPFVDDFEPPQKSRFHRQGGRDAGVGCTGSPVCLSQPCLNGGTCEDLFGLFSCWCTPGWEGQYCQDDTDDCESEPCVHGSCRDLLADYECDCLPGYGGKDCNEDLDNCPGHGCENGGTCVDGLNSYTCVCPPDFRGPLCRWSYPPAQCYTDVICVHGVCRDGLWGANCTCRPGYTGDRCESEIDECESSPCQHGGSCLDRLNTFQCVCVPGYAGPRCETSKQQQRERVSWLAVAVPLACCCVLLASVGLAFGVLTARRKRQSEGAYSPSQQEVAGARLEMDSVLKVPPEERLI